MSGWLSYFGGRRDTNTAARDAIVALRTQVTTLEKKEEYLFQQAEAELSKARANASSNKSVATAALRRKKLLEGEVERVGGMRLALEKQAIDLESANLNRETLAAMDKAAKALQLIHGRMPDVHKTMDDLNDQRMLAAEITDAITASMQDSISADIDEEELEKELQQLQEDELDSLTRGLRDVEAPIGDLQVGRGVQDELALEEERERREVEQLQRQLAAM